MEVRVYANADFAEVKTEKETEKEEEVEAGLQSDAGIFVHSMPTYKQASRTVIMLAKEEQH